MTRFALRRLEPEYGRLVPGAEVGRLEVGDRFTVEVPDEELRVRLEELLHSPLTGLRGDPTGRTLSTFAVPLEPGTPEHLRELAQRLESKEYRLQMVPLD